jgi:Ribbon-helix-helix domain
MPVVLHFRHMSTTVTIRLPKELASWLDQASKQSGIPKGRIVREQLERARDGGKEPSFMRLAGAMRGSRDLSTRKGFSRS